MITVCYSHFTQSRLLILVAVTLLQSIFFVAQPVHGDAVDDLWNQYMQQSQQQQAAAAAASYESTITRRERNLDHWDIPTACAYLGLHPVTFEPLPQFASDESTSTKNSNASGGLSTSASSSMSSSQTQQATAVDEYIGHDAAILFYAQWCRNCHAVAPSWDAIATHLNAGSQSSNLIMALFDCEKTTQHTELCSSAGIKAYPTIMYVGRNTFHDTDMITRSILGKDKSAGPYGATTLPRTVKFQGNWQYADQILDWISIMKGLGRWHGVVNDSGPLRSVRNLLFKVLTGGTYRGGDGGRGGRGSGKGGKGESLPVGIPPNFQAELRGGLGSASSATTGTSTAATSQEIKNLEMKLNTTKEEKNLYEKAVTHSSHLLNGMLLPTKKSDASDDTTTASRDPFTILTKSDGWYQNATSLPTKDSPNDEHPSILRSCTLELSIDYCTRITTRETNVYLEELAKIPETDAFPSIDVIEKHLLDEVKKVEPYCGIIESCIVSNFESDEACRPLSCPFENEAACGYVSSCLDPVIQDEYGVALGLIKDGEKVMNTDWSNVGGGSGAGGTSSSTNAGDDTSSSATSADKSSSAGVGGWGVPVPVS